MFGYVNLFHAFVCGFCLAIAILHFIKENKGWGFLLLFLSLLNAFLAILSAN